MKNVFRSVFSVGLFAAAALAPTAAVAQANWGYYYFNDGAGTCGYVYCGELGCAVVDTFPCPREVGDD